MPKMMTMRPEPPCHLIAEWSPVCAQYVTSDLPLLSICNMLQDASLSCTHSRFADGKKECAL